MVVTQYWRTNLYHYNDHESRGKKVPGYVTTNISTRLFVYGMQSD